MTRTPPRRTVRRHHINLRGLLTMLRLIERHAGITSAEIGEVTGLSRPSVCRLIEQARAYGVALTFQRTPHGGEYTLEDWGIFSAVRARRWCDAWLEEADQAPRSARRQYRGSGSGEIAAPATSGAVAPGGMGAESGNRRRSPRRGDPGAGAPGGAGKAGKRAVARGGRR